MRRILYFILILCSASSVALADPDEDALFGGGDETGGVTAPAERKEGLLDTFAGRELLKDRLEIGGLLQLRLDTTISERTAAKDAPLTSPNLADLYFDARPNDRLRGFINVRVRHDPTVTTEDEEAAGETAFTQFGQTSDIKRDQFILDQMWMKFDIKRAVYVTVGKQRVKYGAARFWNPTDFVNRVIRDPLAVFDERTGVDLIRFQIPVEKLGWNFFAIADVDSADRLGDVGGIVRGEFVFGTAEMSITGQARRNEPSRIGMDLSAGVGPFDVYLEGAAMRDNREAFYRGTLDLMAAPFPTLPESYFRNDEWIPQVSGGFDVSIKYNDQDSLLIGAEYFYNDAGYQDETLYPVLYLTGQYQPLYTGRHYAGMFFLLTGPGSWNSTTFMLSTLGNVSDGSYTARFDYSVKVLTYLSFSAYVSHFFGTNGGEFRPGFTLTGNPDLPEDLLPEPYDSVLRNGLSIASPMYQCGIRLSMDL